MPSADAYPDPLTAATLLPHRGRMLLVGEILALDEEQATTLSVAHRDWPLFEDGVVNPLILVELVAQTAGVHNGLKRIQTRGQGPATRGWLVGVKKAVFYVPAIALGEPVTTTARNAFVFDNLREITGTASINGRLAAEVTLQVVEASESQPAHG
jgi:predicted hotdog family 3-hydroxylacyl-ACP dehydratase